MSILTLSYRAQESPQEVDYGLCGSVEFVDDYRLLIRLGSTSDMPPSLVLRPTNLHRRRQLHN